jgi:hypothetical protein
LIEAVSMRSVIDGGMLFFTPKDIGPRLKLAMPFAMVGVCLLTAGVEACSSSEVANVEDHAVDGGDASSSAEASFDAEAAADAAAVVDARTSGGDTGDALSSDAASADVSSSDATTSDGFSSDVAISEASSDASDASEICSLATGLVGYWPFEEGTGSTTADTSGNANNGTLVNSPSWSESVPPTKYTNTHSLSFDGSQSYVTMGNPTQLQITGALSLAAWFKTSATLANYRTLVSKWYSGSTDGAFTLLWTNSGGPTLLVENSGLQVLGAAAPSVYTDGVWHFVVGTWDGATTARLYVDGHQVSVTTLDASFGPLQSNTDPFDVGTDNRYAAGTGDRFFPGSIDEVRVYSRALTAAEVGALFNGSCAAL